MSIKWRVLGFFFFVVEEALVCADGSEPEILPGFSGRGGRLRWRPKTRPWWTLSDVHTTSVSFSPTTSLDSSLILQAERIPSYIL